MDQRNSILVLLGAVSLTAACGADGTSGSDGTGGSGGSSGTNGAAATSGAAGTPGAGTSGAIAGTGGASGASGAEPIVWPECVADEEASDGAPCTPSGFPFAVAAFPHSFCEECLPPGGTMRMSQPEPGTLCLSGVAEPVEEDAAGIIVGFIPIAAGSTIDSGTFLELFNPTAKGITKFRFTIDNPPPGGIQVWADTLNSLECTSFGSCINWGFRLPEFVTESGTPVTASLADFVSTQGGTFDPRALNEIFFDVAPGAFDYCVRDFQFLGENDQVVMDTGE